MKVPNIGPAQRLLCALGWHHRDRRTRRHDGYDVTAECIGCGRPMIYHRTGWQIDHDNVRERSAKH